MLHRTGFRANDAYSAYREMGAPRKLTPTQIMRLNSLTLDLPVIDQILRSRSDATLNITISMNANDIVLVE